MNSMRILVETGHGFRLKLDTDSISNWTPILVETGHGFQRKLDT